MPSAVSVVGSAVVVSPVTSIPMATPTAVPPAAGHHGTDGDSEAEPNNACRSHSASGRRDIDIRRDNVRVAVDDCRVVLRNVDDLRIRRLDHDDLWRLLYHRNLGSSFQIAGCFRFGAQ